MSSLARTSGSIALGQKDRWEPSIFAGHLMRTLLVWERVLCCASHGLSKLRLLPSVQTLALVSPPAVAVESQGLCLHLCLTMKNPDIPSQDSSLASVRHFWSAQETLG